MIGTDPLGESMQQRERPMSAAEFRNAIEKLKADSARGLEDAKELHRTVQRDNW
jgi:hypothetical protein